MQAYGLTVDRFLDHAAKWHGEASVVTAGIDGGDAVIGYAPLRERANRLSGALLDMGIAPGDRIATLAWNTQHHVEVWYGVMGVGIVCHTLNPRLTVAHLAAQIVKKLEGQASRFEIELTPAGLGKVEVRMEVSAHGHVAASLSFDNPQAAGSCACGDSFN